MADIDQIPKTYEQAVETLAEWHGSGQAIEIYSFPDPVRKVVKLIEVSDDFAASGSVAPVGMGASAEFPFQSSVALLSGDEWEAVLRGDMQLPQDWDLETRTRVWPR